MAILAMLKWPKYLNNLKYRLMKLIDKDAVLVEIDKLFDLHSSKHDIDEAGVVLLQLRENVESLEVKEVDLDKEVEDYWHNSDLSWCRDAYSMTHIRTMLSSIAKHFFELGLKSQKGE